MNKTAEKFDTDLSWDHVDKADTVINKTFEAHNTSIGNVRLMKYNQNHKLISEMKPCKQYVKLK